MLITCFCFAARITPPYAYMSNSSLLRAERVGFKNLSMCAFFGTTFG